MKTILIWSPPLSEPKRVTVDDTIASAAVRAGVATPVDPRDLGPLSAGGAVSPDNPVMIALGQVEGERKFMVRLAVPSAVASIAFGLGAAAPVQAGAPAPTPTPTPMSVTGLPLANATTGVAYEDHLTIVGGSGPFSSSLLSGSRPTGLTITFTGSDMKLAGTLS